MKMTTGLFEHVGNTLVEFIWEMCVLLMLCVFIVYGVDCVEHLQDTREI